MRNIKNWRKLEVALIVVLGSIIALDLVYVFLNYKMSSQFWYMWKNF